MNLKLTLKRLLVLLLIAGITSHSYAQKKPSKLSPDLIELQKNQSADQQQAESANSAARTAASEGLKAMNNLQIFDEHVVIEAIATTDPSVLLVELEVNGLQKGSYFGGLVSGLFPINKISTLEGISALKYARPAYKPMTNIGSVTSQGDLSQLSDVSRASFGVDGSGFRVGVLSDSWDNLGGQASGIASGDLPSDIIVIEELPGGGSDEGRAMGELIFDVAPGSSLAFHTAFLGQPDFANGILDLAAAGSDVIVDDVIYFAEPMFQDGIIGQAADMVVDAGIPYFSSAGNNLDESYESPFNNGGTFDLADFFSGAPIGEYVLHDFDPGEGVDFFQEVVIGDNGGDILLSFQWDDPFASVCAGCPGADTDLDVFLALVDGDFNSMFFDLSAANPNIGGDPVEILGVSAGGAVTAYLVIGKWTGKVGDMQYDLGPNPDPGLIKYVNFGSVSITEFATQSGTSFGHSNAAGAVSVGAVRYDRSPEYGTNPPLREVFSSSGGVPTFYDIQGNRIDKEVRRKPEISAVQGTNNTFFGFDYEGDGFPNFFGTSASAPHAAGVAALMLQAADGNLTPAQITTAMMESAVDMDDPRSPEFDTGFDFATGAGFLQADAAIGAVLGVPSVYRFVLIDPFTDTPIRTLRDGETIEITPDLDGFFNIEALVSDGGQRVKHVKFDLRGDGILKKLKRSESRAPYVLFGDWNGNYFPGILPVANYTLEAEPYAKKRKYKGSPNTIAFNVEIVQPEAPVASNLRTQGSDAKEATKELENLANELLDSEEFIVYPNPSSGQVNFIWNTALEGGVELSIFDTSGRIMESFQSDGAFEHTIDFSKYKRGVHIARIITPTSTDVRRFVIQ
jgi:hypothetical protein